MTLEFRCLYSLKMVKVLVEMIAIPAVT